MISIFAVSHISHVRQLLFHILIFNAAYIADIRYSARQWQDDLNGTKTNWNYLKFPSILAFRWQGAVLSASIEAIHHVSE